MGWLKRIDATWQGSADCGSVKFTVVADCLSLLCLRPGSAGLRGASGLTSIERTAYPQFRRFTTARVLHVFFTPTEDEAAWARERTETPAALLALLVDLKCFQKMARFCAREEVPAAVIDHVRHCAGLDPETEPDHGAARTAKWHRAQVRKRQGVTYDMRRARTLAEAAIREAALVRNHPPDLISVALERIIEASLELPGYSTLDDMATTIRAEVNEAIFAGIVARMGPEGRLRAQGLLATAASDGRSMFNRLKKPAKRATWSRFRAQAKYLDEVDEIGDTAYWLEDVAPSKVTDFAGEAAAQDVDTLSRYGDSKRLALVACLAHAARMRARDDLAEMLCKRVSSIVKKAKTELEEIRLRQRAASEKLIGTYRTVLESLDPDAEEPGDGPARAVAAVEEAGGFAAQLADIEEVSAYHGDNYEVLVHRFFRMDRATMFDLAGKLGLVATSSDASVLTALEHARAWHTARRDHIPLPTPAGGEDAYSGIAFASGNWRRAVTDRRYPGTVARRHFEAMVFTYLAEELRTGDIAVTGAGEYADWRANLLPWEDCEPLLEAFCAGVGLPATAAGFTARLRHAHLDAASALDAGYEDNADLVIGEDGTPSVKRRRSAGTPKAAERLAEAVERRMPERSLLSITARTAYWLGWHHHFGPASGSDPKISDPLGRYCMAVFTGGANIGPYEAARHIAGVSARELSMVRNRHIDLKKLNSAIATVVNAFNELDVVKAWGDGTTVAADGTQVETYIDNLLAETSIRYGGVGGIAYHYISDTYVALFSRFIPCGVWEAVHLIEGLLANESDIQPSTVHADTQGQSAPVFALATVYPHTDALFGERGRNVIDWKLIERHWQDLMQVAISISEGRLSSATLMRRLRSNSRKNRIYKVFREVGRSVRTVALLRYLADPHLRARITAATNKVESYNGFSHWLGFGNNGILASNDPAEQEKQIKLNTLLANLVIFHNAIDIMDVVRSLAAEGWLITADQLGTMSPYLRAHISRFGAWATDDLARRPEAFNPVLVEVDFTTDLSAAA
jgi:TnpA family transposase